MDIEDIRLLDTYSIPLFKKIIDAYNIFDLISIQHLVDRDPFLLDAEREVYIDNVIKERHAKHMADFCKNSNPVALMMISDENKKLLLKVAPISYSVHRFSKDIYTDRSLNVMDILSPVEPLNFTCEDFEPLDWIGSSCYADSALMALFAVPNEFITNNMLNATLKPFPSGRHKYICTKKMPIGQKASPEIDLANRQKVQASLVDIAESIRRTGKVANCTSLRKILEACPHPEKFHKTGDRDSGEYLSYLISMFPETEVATVTTTISKSKDAGKTWNTVSSAINKHGSIIWNVSPYTLKEISDNTYYTTGALLESLDVEDTSTEEGEELTETNDTFTTSPYLIIHAQRADPELSEDDEGFFIDKKILPTEHITFFDGSRVALSAIVMWKQAHYTAYIRCRSEYYYYDDGVGKVEDPISYMDMLMYDDRSTHDDINGRPLVQTNGTLYFYVKAEPITIPSIS